MTSSAGTTYRGSRYVYAFRATFVLCLLLLIYQADYAQRVVDRSWKCLLDSWLFNCVYFETFFATFWHSAIACVYPRITNAFRGLDAYKISDNMQFVYYERSFILDSLIYMAPLMLLDTFMVKRYHGVEPSIWVEKRASLIQTTRALPLQPPTVFQICFHLVASFIVFDALFFIAHFTFHKNSFLYKYIHSSHHDHKTVDVHVTNQLTIPERVTLVLLANESLKVFNSHPMTRMIFVPLFLGILIDNHSGYDLPTSLHRLVPFGLVGGSVHHYGHHMQGTRHYEFIFTYLDRILDTLSNRNTTRLKRLHSK